MENIAFWTIALGVMAGLAWLLTGNFVAECRDRRKRRRNYGRVISRAKRPVVMLSVNTK
jgi:hypothetical protein